MYRDEKWDWLAVSILALTSAIAVLFLCCYQSTKNLPLLIVSWLCFFALLLITWAGFNNFCYYNKRK